MNQDPRGTISRHGNLLRIDNALVEEVSVSDNNRNTGHMLISYAVHEPRQTTSIQTLRLNINRNTTVLNSLGRRICFCDIREGMWVDTIFSSAMTRSIPPQANAFLVIARNRRADSSSTTTDRIASVDTENNFLYTGNPNNINSQIRFVISNATTISDRNGRPIRLRSLRPGQMVKINHANFMTASIPPQTTAFHVQVI